METSNHHKRLKNEFPSWLWFPLYQEAEPQHEWNEKKDSVARRIIKSLTTHLDVHDLANELITKPNPYDFAGMYSRKEKELDKRKGGEYTLE
jgi:hypothetical protein